MERYFVSEKFSPLKSCKTVKKAASSVGNIGESFSKTFENIKNIEFTDKQSPEERMEVFTDAYVSPNYTPVPIRMRKEGKAFKLIEHVFLRKNFYTHIHGPSFS